MVFAEHDGAIQTFCLKQLEVKETYSIQVDHIVTDIVKISKDSTFVVGTESSGSGNPLKKLMA